MTLKYRNQLNEFLTKTQHSIDFARQDIKLFIDDLDTPTVINQFKEAIVQLDDISMLIQKTIKRNEMKIKQLTSQL